MTPSVRYILTLALDDLEATYRGWLGARMATEAERDLARMRITAVKEARDHLGLTSDLAPEPLNP